MDERQLEEMRSNIDNIKTVLLSFNKKLDQQNERITYLERNSVSVMSGQKSVEPVTFSQPSSSESLLKTDTSNITNVSREPSFDVLEWLSVDWPMKVGALLLILGMSWFVSYAFLNNWIGPIGRVSLGLLAGAGLLAFGQWRFQKSVGQGAIFVALGGMFLFMTITAGRHYYHFFDQLSASMFMLLIVTYIAFMSIRMQNKTLAVMGLLFGSIVPLLVGSDEAHFVNLFLYLFILSVGASLVTWRIGYRALLGMNIVVVILYSIPYTVFESSFHHMNGLVISTLFAALFFMVSFMTMLKNGQIDREDLVVSSLNSMALLGWIRVAVEDEWRGFACLCVALILSIVAYGIALTNQKHQSFAYLRFASAFLFVFAAIVFQFSGPTLVLVLAAKFTILTIVTKKLLHDDDGSSHIASLMIIPLVLSLPYLLEYFSGAFVSIENYVVILGMITMLGIMSFMLYVKKDAADTTLSLSMVYAVVASVYILLFIWILVHDSLASETIATFIALLLYTLVGIVLYVKGKISDNAAFIRYGSILFALVIGRLLLVDIWEMSITGRIVTFFIIGALLMSTAFASRKKTTITL